MAPRWNCECCCDTFHDYTSIYIEGSPVCIACVRQMFDKALKFEHDYPPNWSGALHPTEFSHIFSTDYISRYVQKEVEYKTQPSKRIYCQHEIPRSSTDESGKVLVVHEACGYFVGMRQKSTKPDMLMLGRCKECKNLTCMVCDEYSSDPATTLKHVCKGKSCANEKRAQAFFGLKRGKDWQQCPSRLCGRRIELTAACNHISCQCGMGFCFICGKEADGDSEHWRKPGCPRYNQPGDADVEYDGYDDDDDYASSDESEADIMENVRDLFEDGEEDVEPSAVPPPPPQLHTVPPEGNLQLFADMFAGEEPTRVAEEPEMPEQNPGVSNGAEVIASRGAEAISSNVAQAIVPNGPETIASDDAAADSSNDAEANSLNPAAENSLNDAAADSSNDAEGITSDDAAAIASVFWEDDMVDLIDGGHHAFSSPSTSVGPAVTVEEADIDLALWRMAVD